MLPMKATILDDDAVRLLAIPFTGPVDNADIDGQRFTRATDIKPGWFSVRLTDWHHGLDPIMGRTVIGKAVDLGRFDGASDEPDDDGWWVTLWLKHGERRVEMIRRLADAAAKGGKAAIFGSSETLPGMATLRTAAGKVIPWRRDVPGEIVTWPYIRQTLSTSPQNTHSVLRPMKAVLDNLDLAKVPVSDPLRALLTDLDALGSHLQSPSLAGGVAAKAGRVLSHVNEQALREALAKLDEVLAKLRTEQGETDAPE